jgi:hypothetical protein
MRFSARLDTSHHGPSHPFKISSISPSSVTSSKAVIKGFSFAYFHHYWPSLEEILYLRILVGDFVTVIFYFIIFAPKSTCFGS